MSVIKIKGKFKVCEVDHLSSYKQHLVEMAIWKWTRVYWLYFFESYNFIIGHSEEISNFMS